MKSEQPSATAYLIATSTIFVAADRCAGRFVSARAAALSALFVEAPTRVARLAHRALRTRLARPFVHALERLTIPGIQLHYALRKLYLEETARRALAGGVRQVVILGAGYDTLALRLHEEFPGVEFIETDHPATQRRKTHALGRNTAHTQQPRAATNLHFLSVDLTRDDLRATLERCPSYHADAPTLFIAEGLLMYLAPDEVDALFHAISASGGASSRVAFTFMEPQTNGRINFRTPSRVVNAWLGRRREVFRWGIERGALGDYLAARGFILHETATDETFRGRYLEPSKLAHLPLAAGEYVCVASLAEKEGSG